MPDTSRFLLCLLVMAGVTYLIRMLPLVFFRQPIRNRFARSFLHYVPYAALSAMTFPAIFSMPPPAPFPQQPVCWRRCCWRTAPVV